MKEQHASGVYLRLLMYLKPFWKRVIVLFICTALFASLSGVSLTLIPPFLNILFSETTMNGKPAGNADSNSLLIPDAVESRINHVKDHAKLLIYSGTQVERLERFCIIFFLLMLAKNIFEYFSVYLTIYLEQSILKRIRRDLYGKIQMLPMSFFDTRRTGHLISHITNDVTNLRGAVVGSLTNIIRNSLMTLIAITIIFYTSWRLSLLTLVLVPLNIGLIAIISRKLRKGSRRAQERMADMTAVLQEAISGVRVVKAFSMEEFEKEKFDIFNVKYLREYLKMRRYAELASPTSEMLGMVATVIILWYGGRLVITGGIAPASLMMFLVAMLWVVNPIRNLSKLNSMIQEGLASGQRVFTILDIPTEGEKSGNYEISELKDSIIYKDVNFAYEASMPILKDINMTINRGQVVALVGASGSGKTTLADLLPRFYKPVSGTIKLDGRDISDIRLSSLRSLMGIVTQETILFNDTVFRNIAYGDEDCSMEKVIEAAKAANAHQFISAMPKGYQTVIGDRGVQLSGGQRQRLAIARALLKNPQILILDEATSSLDVESEALVQEAIDRLVKGRTTLVIAHRLSTIKNADKIIVLEDGKIHQVGTHEELIGEEGTYRRLYHLQISA